MTQERDSSEIIQASEALAHAAGHGRTEQVRKALADGGWPDYQRTDQTMVLVATRNQYLETVELLVQAGANLNLRSRAGRTPMHEAAELGRADLIAVLAKSPHAVHWDTPDIMGDAPMHVAVRAKSIEAVEALAAQGAGIDLRNYQDQTPVFLAAASERPELLAFFLERGVNLAQQDVNGNTVIDAARAVGWDLGVRMIEQAQRAQTLPVEVPAAPAAASAAADAAPTVSRIGKRPR